MTEALVQSVGLFANTSKTMNRIDGMYACLEAIRAWYDLFFAIPEIELAGLPFFFYIELCQSQAGLYRLSTIDDPMWDKEIVRRTADLLTILDRTADKFLITTSMYPAGCPDDEDGGLFVKGAKLMRTIKQAWEPILTQHFGGLPTPNSQVVNESAPHAAAMETPDISLLGASMEFADTEWMSEMFGIWDY